MSSYIIYYGERAKKCKFKYYTLSIIKILAIGLIPVLERINFLDNFLWIVALASSISLSMEAIIGLVKLRSK